MSQGGVGRYAVLVSTLVCVAVLCGLAGPALAQGYLAPDVVLEVHPNERAPGQSSVQFLGGSPWTQPTASAHNSYVWQKYVFAASGLLWVQVCAQNWDQWQKGYVSDDNTWLDVNGVKPADFDGIQNGNPGGWQWVGCKENGQRWTLRFLCFGQPGAQSLWIGADESPLVWWIKVTDLEELVIYPD